MRFNVVNNVHKIRAAGFNVTPASQVHTFAMLTVLIVGAVINKYSFGIVPSGITFD
jgi:hypothetical protein